MLLHIPKVLTPEQVAQMRDVLDRTDWEDGRNTAGPQAARVKRNQQLTEEHPVAQQLGDTLLKALGRNELFLSAALPHRVFPPLFNRYCDGGEFGMHVDTAVRDVRGKGIRVRTDLSATLFLSEPHEYDGGELVMDDTYGAHAAKLPAGDMVLYPSTSLHRVNAVTRGARVAAICWVQSLVREDAQRTLLYEMDTALQALNRSVPEHPSLLQLTGVYHNLLRRWADL
ncbi:PKHD-type hydroxylase [Hydrocarboniphaga daqingensis]|uniref:PKHD-type hydroxylase n=1 Tax=Hydrocarboniphaga daqingensis TaxID=490188 RepID=A0A1M5KAU4_9GAMM|nr:Fe2+-dependent dioxygenase [Hydrocarboniphaga daqingensis]SHG49811.1 PKHD-type hydroxylase [Hydrocarboniphaga daqingensis]